MNGPLGFRYAGLHVGIKPGRKDLALVVSDVPAAAAGCFTVNKAKAAPVRDAEARLPAEGARAVLVNSGNANALTGPGGLSRTCQRLREGLAEALGVISRRRPHRLHRRHRRAAPGGENRRAAFPGWWSSLGPGADSAAEAIMTTDTRSKMAVARIAGARAEVRLRRPVPRAPG